MQFKDILKELRKKHNISQKYLAKQCNLSSTCICQLETGARNPTGNTLSALSNFFGCTIDYLLGRSNDKECFMDFPNRLRKLRLENNLTQKELAQRLGLSSNIICEWEKGRCSPSIESLKILSSIFECSIDYIVNNTDDLGVIALPSSSSNAPELTSEEQRLLETFRKLYLKNRMHVSAYADVRLEEQENSSFRVK